MQITQRFLVTRVKKGKLKNASEVICFSSFRNDDYCTICDLSLNDRPDVL